MLEENLEKDEWVQTEFLLEKNNRTCSYFPENHLMYSWNLKFIPLLSATRIVAFPASLFLIK